MTTGKTIRKEREELGATLETISNVSGVSIGTLSRWERESYRPSDAAERAVLCTLAALQAIRGQYDGLPLNLNALKWLKGQIAALNGGADARLIREAREAL